MKSSLRKAQFEDALTWLFPLLETLSLYFTSSQREIIFWIFPSFMFPFSLLLSSFSSFTLSPFPYLLLLSFLSCSSLFPCCHLLFPSSFLFDFLVLFFPLSSVIPSFLIFPSSPYFFLRQKFWLLIFYQPFLNARSEMHVMQLTPFTVSFTEEF